MTGMPDYMTQVLIRFCNGKLPDRLHCRLCSGGAPRRATVIPRRVKREAPYIHMQPQSQSLRPAAKDCAAGESSRARHLRPVSAGPLTLCTMTLCTMTLWPPDTLRQGMQPANTRPEQIAGIKVAGQAESGAFRRGAAPCAKCRSPSAMLPAPQNALPPEKPPRRQAR